VPKVRVRVPPITQTDVATVATTTNVAIQAGLSLPMVKKPVRGWDLQYHCYECGFITKNNHDRLQHNETHIELQQQESESDCSDVDSDGNDSGGSGDGSNGGNSGGSGVESGDEGSSDTSGGSGGSGAESDNAATVIELLDSEDSSVSSESLNSSIHSSLSGDSTIIEVLDTSIESELPAANPPSHVIATEVFKRGRAFTDEEAGADGIGYSAVTAPPLAQKVKLMAGDGSTTAINAMARRRRGAFDDEGDE
jgi:hypothetical protein